MSGVVIIGAGQAGAEAALSLRQFQYAEPVIVVGDEPTVPYSRPPLSKDFLLGTLPPEKLALRAASAYERAGVSLRLGEAAVALDPASHTVTLASGERLLYDACIIATGSSARRLPLPGADLRGILTLRTWADAKWLQGALQPDARLAVIGAGYLGLEVAASARKLGHDVTVIEAGPRILGRSASDLAARALARRHEAEGVRLLLGLAPAGFAGGHDGRVRAVVMADGSEIGADVVVVSVGGVPATGIALAAGIHCGNGITADPDARTSAADVYSIGDCAHWDAGDGRGHLRLESVQMASRGARAAAAAIAGQPRPAVKQPYFWSNQYNLRLQIAGWVPPGLATEDHLEGDPADAFWVTRSIDGKLLAVEAVNSPAEYIKGQQLIGQPLCLNA